LNHREISLDFRQSEIRAEMLQIWAAKVFPIGWEMQTNRRNLGGQDMPAFWPDFTLRKSKLFLQQFKSTSSHWKFG
jgi:hypothetical protein